MKKFLLSLVCITGFLFSASVAYAQAPTITAIHSSEDNTSGSDKILTVNGTNLINGTTKVYINGVATTNLPSFWNTPATYLRVLLPSSLYSIATTHTVTLSNDNGVTFSNAKTLVVGKESNNSGSVLIFPFYKFSDVPTLDDESSLTIRSSGGSGTNNDSFVDNTRTAIGLSVMQYVRIIAVSNSAITNLYSNFRTGSDLSIALANIIPNNSRGFLIVVAVDSSGRPIKNNSLSGLVRLRTSIVSTEVITGTIEPYVLKKLSNTNAPLVNNNYQLEFDGINYDRLPGVLNFQSVVYRPSATSHRLVVATIPADLTGISPASVPTNRIAFFGPTSRYFVRLMGWHNVENPIVLFGSSNWNAFMGTTVSGNFVTPLSFMAAVTNDSNTVDNSQATRQLNGMPLLGAYFVVDGSKTGDHYMSTTTKVSTADAYTVSISSALGTLIS